MQSKQLMAGAAVILGLLMLIVAALYFTQAAGALPAFLPGYAAGSATHHAKHGILALALAIVCFVAARFFYGPTNAQSGKSL